MRYRPTRERTIERTVGIARCEIEWREQRDDVASVRTD
jgi:hypothetical protein